MVEGKEGEQQVLGLKESLAKLRSEFRVGLKEESMESLTGHITSTGGEDVLEGKAQPSAYSI